MRPALLLLAICGIASSLVGCSGTVATPLPFESGVYQGQIADFDGLGPVVISVGVDERGSEVEGGTRIRTIPAKGGTIQLFKREFVGYVHMADEATWRADFGAPLGTVTFRATEAANGLNLRWQGRTSGSAFIPRVGDYARATRQVPVPSTYVFSGQWETETGAHTVPPFAQNFTVATLEPDSMGGYDITGTLYGLPMGGPENGSDLYGTDLLLEGGSSTLYAVYNSMNFDGSDPAQGYAAYQPNIGPQFFAENLTSTLQPIQ